MDIYLTNDKVQFLQSQLINPDLDTPTMLYKIN